MRFSAPTFLLSLLWVPALEAANVLEILVVVSNSGTKKYNGLTGSSNATRQEITSLLAYIDGIFGSSLEIRLSEIKLNMADSYLTSPTNLAKYVSSNFQSSNMPDFVLGIDHIYKDTGRAYFPGINACRCKPGDCKNVDVRGIMRSEPNVLALAKTLARVVGVKLKACTTPSGNWMGGGSDRKNPNFYQPSSCAKDEIEAFAQADGSCLTETTAAPFPEDTPELGEYLGPQQMCKRQHSGTVARPPYNPADNLCSQFACLKIRGGPYDYSYQIPRAETYYRTYGVLNGTPCGRHKRCINKQCVSTTACTQPWVTNGCFYGDMPSVWFLKYKLCKDMSIKDCAQDVVYRSCCRSCDAY